MRLNRIKFGSWLRQRALFEISDTQSLIDEVRPCAEHLMKITSPICQKLVVLSNVDYVLNHTLNKKEENVFLHLPVA
jgi:hypothetical protein